MQEFSWTQAVCCGIKNQSLHKKDGKNTLTYISVSSDAMCPILNRAQCAIFSVLLAIIVLVMWNWVPTSFTVTFRLHYVREDRKYVATSKNTNLSNAFKVHMCLEPFQAISILLRSNTFINLPIMMRICITHTIYQQAVEFWVWLQRKTVHCKVFLCNHTQNTSSSRLRLK